MGGSRFGIGFVFLIFDADDVGIVLVAHGKSQLWEVLASGSYDALIYKNGEISQMV